MTEYSFLHNSEKSKYAVIAKDQNDDYWYVVVDRIKYEYVARQISKAMAIAETAKHKNG